MLFLFIQIFLCSFVLYVNTNSVKRTFAQISKTLSVDFIKSKVGSASLSDALDQQNQISYFTQSKIQGEVTKEYIKAWEEKNYRGNDYFFNWVKSIFKTDNFLSFIKYYRNPNPASKLINNKILSPLSRVFFSDDSYFKYNLFGSVVERPEEIEKEINEKLFKALLFNHNAIMIHDLSEPNQAYRRIVDIKNVVSLYSKDNIIHQIAYSAEIVVDGKRILGYVYMDKDKYLSCDKNFKNIVEYPHDLGMCPADYISDEAFSNDDIVRKSIFSYVREQLEEYTFLKTLQRMVEPNGALPITTQIKTAEKNKINNPDIKEPMALNSIKGQSPEDKKTIQGGKSPLQAGTIIKVPANRLNDGSFDVDLAKNFLNFFYLPVESLTYLNNRVKAIESDIISSVLGDYVEANESAKNELQVSKSFVTKEDVLRGLSISLSKIRTASDYKLLALKYGFNNVIVDVFYGSDFFLESQQELYEMFKVAPNGIERRGILNRLAQSRNKFNKEKATRETILYKILPYVSDEDFTKAIDNQAVADEVFQLQTRFDYWVSLFEARYGNIVVFWIETETPESEKLIIINNLLLELINSNNLKPQENGD